LEETASLGKVLELAVVHFLVCMLLEGVRQEVDHQVMVDVHVSLLLSVGAVHVHDLEQENCYDPEQLDHAYIVEWQC
jgi:hypothetical protein